MRSRLLRRDGSVYASAVVSPEAGEADVLLFHGRHFALDSVTGDYRECQVLELSVERDDVLVERRDRG